MKLPGFSFSFIILSTITLLDQESSDEKPFKNPLTVKSAPVRKVFADEFFTDKLATVKVLLLSKPFFK